MTEFLDGFVSGCSAELASFVAWARYYFDDGIVGTEIKKLAAPIEVRALKSALNRIHRAKRNSDKGPRHPDDVIVYHGPVIMNRITQQRLLSECRSVRNRKGREIAVGVTDADYCVAGYEIAAGSRIIFEGHTGVLCEGHIGITITSAARGNMIVLWKSQAAWQRPDTPIPQWAASGVTDRVYPAYSPVGSPGPFEGMRAVPSLT